MKQPTQRTKELRERRRQDRETILHWHVAYTVVEVSMDEKHGITTATLEDRERGCKYLLFLYTKGYIWGACYVIKSFRPYTSRWLRNDLLGNMREFGNYIRANKIELVPGMEIKFQHNGTMR